MNNEQETTTEKNLAVHSCFKAKAVELSYPKNRYDSSSLKGILTSSSTVKNRPFKKKLNESSRILLIAKKRGPDVVF